MTTLIPKIDLMDGGLTPTGAVNRNFNTKLAEWISVKDFGAVGDGTTDDTTAIQNAITFGSTNKNKIFIPAGTYKITSKIAVPEYSKVYGSGSASTIILANVTGDIAFELQGAGSPTYPYYTIEFCDLYVKGDATSSVASTATGGVLVSGVEHVLISRVQVSNICSAGWASIGNPATELRFGIKINGVVGAIVNDCYCSYNDVGFSVDKGIVSTNTTTTFTDCASSINRTHAVLWVDTMTTQWNGGVMESNNGKDTVLINSSSVSSGLNNAIRGVHFEDNHRTTTVAPGDGTREIHVIGGYNNSLSLEGLMFGSDTDFCVEIDNGTDSAIYNCLFSGFGSYQLNTTALNTTILGCNVGSIPIDDGVNTKVFSNNFIINDSATISASTPSASSKTYAKLPTSAITEIANGQDGQIIYLQGQAGSVLDSAVKFQLVNGATQMTLAPGSILTVRSDNTSTKWVAIAHAPSVLKTNITNGATPAIDDREIWTVNDTNSTAITNITNGYEGQRITIICKTTGANTVTITHGTNIKLAGAANFVMNISDTLTLIYDFTALSWYEVCRSVN